MRLQASISALGALLLVCLVRPVAADDAVKKALENERDRVKAEKELVEQRAGLEKAKVDEAFAREKALKDLFGASQGREGTINVDAAKTPLIRVQPAGAEAVRGLAAKMCKQLSLKAPNEKVVLTSEAQLKAESEALGFKENFDRLIKELADSLEKAGAAPPVRMFGAPEALLLLPVAANAIASVLKLFRSDLALAASDNPNFAALFADFLLITPECTAFLFQPNPGTVKAQAVEKANSLQLDRARALELVRQADAFLKGKEAVNTPVIVRLRVVLDALRDATGVLAPAAQGSKLADYGAALAMSETMGSAPRLTYKLETQQVQITKTGLFTGARLERSGSSQVFYRKTTQAGKLVDAGYFAYSTAQAGVKVEEEEFWSVSPIAAPAGP